MRRLIALVGLLAVLAACNTVDGMGRDISGAARTVQNTF